MLEYFKFKLSQNAWSTLSIYKVITLKHIQKIRLLQCRLLHYNRKQTLIVKLYEKEYNTKSVKQFLACVHHNMKHILT